MSEKIPNFQQLLEVLKPIYKANHDWDGPEIDFSSLEEKNWLSDTIKFYTIRVKFICKICGTEKICKPEFIDGRWHFYSWQYQMRYPLNYYDSACYRKYLTRGLKKREKLAKIKCPICNSLLSAHIFESHHQRCEKEYLKWKVKEEMEKTIQRNLQIIQKIKGNKNTVAIKRLRYAIYRLYKQLGLSPKQIAEKIGCKEENVKRHIAKAFMEQCLSNDSCVFKNFFKGYVWRRRV